MHDPQAVAGMTGAEFIGLTDALSRNDLTELLSWFWGSDAEAFTNGLNWLDMRKQASAARQAARAHSRAAARDEPCSADAARVLADAIATGTPVAVTNPPYHVTGAEACCLVETGNYICNAQAGHDGPEHVAYGSHGEECHRWSVAETPASVTA